MIKLIFCNTRSGGTVRGLSHFYLRNCRTNLNIRFSNIRAFHSTRPLRIFDPTLLSGLANMSLLDLTNLCYEHMVSLKIYGSELLRPNIDCLGLNSPNPDTRIGYR